MMTKELLEIHKDGLTLGGKPFYIASGDMQYFRFFKGGWRRRLELMKDFGLTCVQTYVPWNLHEPEKGEYHFEDNLDIAAFIRLCGEVGLKVLLRPSPYMCAEWDLGGLPYWLLKDRSIAIRTSDEGYMRHVRDYYARLMPQVVPLLSTNGGPIIAVAVENEYGSFGNDTLYLRQMADLLIQSGVDVPLFTANGGSPKHLIWGSLPELWSGVDAREGTPAVAEVVRRFQGDKPLMVCEEWAGCAQQWGGVFNRQSIEEACRHYKTSLDSGYMVNFYMFCGGTSFGFMSGANYGLLRADVPGAAQRYIPFTTSYDTDAPVSEEGVPTEKYFALKKILAEHLGKPYEEKTYDYRAQAPGKVVMTKAAPFFENADAVAEKTVRSGNVHCMEDLDQAYGYILYETFLPHTDDYERLLCMKGFGDRATVYGNGQYLGAIMRDRTDEVRFHVPEGGLTLSILVENLGRVCYGYPLLFDRKGIERCVHLDAFHPVNGMRLHDYSVLMNWTIRTLPMKDLSGVRYSCRPKADLPGFYAGEFDAEEGVDSFLRLPGWTKGFVCINGFNLGRYWSIGPQETLYVPGELLKEHNTIEIFELHNAPADLAVEFLDHPLLDSIHQNTDVLLQSERA